MKKIFIGCTGFIAGFIVCLITIVSAFIWLNANVVPGVIITLDRETASLDSKVRLDVELIANRKHTTKVASKIGWSLGLHGFSHTEGSTKSDLKPTEITLPKRYSFYAKFEERGDNKVAMIFPELEQERVFEVHDGKQSAVPIRMVLTVSHLRKKNTSVSIEYVLKFER